MKHKFVEYIPPEIEENILYISLEYNVAKHKCPCGCGSEIVTTLSPVRWQLTYNGETVSLYPSIGNWSHACKSHYFIKNDEVVWAGPISQNQINEVIQNDKEYLEKHIKDCKKSQSFIDWIKSIFNFK